MKKTCAWISSWIAFISQNYIYYTWWFCKVETAHKLWSSALMWLLGSDPLHLHPLCDDLCFSLPGTDYWRRISLIRSSAWNKHTEISHFILYSELKKLMDDWWGVTDHFTSGPDDGPLQKCWQLSVMSSKTCVPEQQTADSVRQKTSQKCAHVF